MLGCFSVCNFKKLVNPIQEAIAYFPIVIYFKLKPFFNYFCFVISVVVEDYTVFYRIHMLTTTSSMTFTNHLKIFVIAYISTCHCCCYVANVDCLKRKDKHMLYFVANVDGVMVSHSLRQRLGNKLKFGESND